jgi:tetratricopeptide (TPR) repeat protein
VRIRIAMILLLLMPAVPAMAAELANSGKGGLQARSFEQLLRYSDSEIDIGTAALLLSERPDGQFDLRRYRQTIDTMAWAIIERLEAKKLKSDYRAIEVVNHYLFDELRYTAVDNADSADQLFLDSVMKNRKGYCLSLSILYLAIGERLGMPVYGVVVPGHFFVRYDDGVRQFNIETTSKGNIAPDDYYMEKFQVPSQGYNAIYMRNLANRETLSCFLNNLSNVRQETGDIDGAIADLETAVRMAPGLSTIYSNLGNLYAKKGWLDKAVGQYNRAIQFNPNESKAYHNRAGAYMTLGRFWDAIRDYDRAISLDPNLIDAHRGLADAYRQEKYYTEAIVRLHRARQLFPTNTDLMTQMADVYRESGDTAKAISTYQQALKAAPADIRAHFGLGVSYGQDGDTDKEIQAYKKAIAAKAKPEEKEYRRLAFFNTGNAYMGKKEYDSALAAYQLALAMKRDDPQTLYNLGVASMCKEDYKAAVEWYEKSLAIEPDSKEAHSSIALALYHQKKYEPAWHHINRARELGAEVQEDLYKILANKAGQGENVPYK